MLPRKRIQCLLITILVLIKSTEQYGSGAPDSACQDQLPRHKGIPPQASAPPYYIFAQQAQVRQGNTVNVTVQSSPGAPISIGGFLLQARQIQNPNRTVGVFVGGPASMSHFTKCERENDTATHSSPDDKDALTFTWLAPNDFLGGVEFRGTVAQNFRTFWPGVKSSLVEVVTPDTPLPPATPTITPPAPTRVAPVIPDSMPKPADPGAALDVIYQGCADTKLCFGVPENCIQKGDCAAIVAVFVAGDVYTFELQGTGSPKYVATGLSMDNKMGDDSAVECVQNDNKISIYTSWTYPREEPYVVRSDSPQDIVQMVESSFIDGKLYCKFRRDVVSTVKGVTFDLANNKYNLMVVAGSQMKDEKRVGFHGIAYGATGAPLALSSVGTAAGASKLLVKLHGSFMLAAWLGAASLGILLARYFRQTWVGQQLGGKDIWFAWHRILMVSTWLLTVAGFIVILVEAQGWSSAGGNHAITGIVTVILCFIQPIGAYFRPHPGTEKRPIFNWVHWLFGNSAHILGIVTIFLGIRLPKSEMPSWAIYIPAAFVAFHVIMHLLLSLTACVSDGRISNGRVNTFPMKDMMGHPRHNTQVDRSTDAPFSGFRKLLLGVYAPIILLFTIAMICLVALAPFGRA